MRPRFLFGTLLILLGLVTACVPVEDAKPAKTNAEYHYLLGVTALNEQNPTEALKEFLKALEFDADDDRIHSGLAEAYWQKQALELAEKHIKRAIELSNGDPSYQNYLGALYLSMERYEDAITAFQQAADNLLFGQPEMSWTGIGQAHYQSQNYPAAQRAYEKALQVNPSFFRAAFHLGELFYSQDRPVEALDMFTRSVQLAPGFVDGHYWQGLVYMKMKEPAKARQAFLEVVRLAPESDTARLARNYLKIIK